MVDIFKAEEDDDETPKGVARRGVEGENAETV
jgi:hypothetical protein